jgi:hypothetical protein
MTLLDRLDLWKTRRGTGNLGALQQLLKRIANTESRDAASLVRLHETLLFLRAYPHSAQIAQLADAILLDFARRVGNLAQEGADLSLLENDAVSGIAGSTHSAVFSYEVARSLARRHGGAIDIDWDWMDDPDKLAPLLARLVPHFADEWPVEAHVPVREWLRRACPPNTTALRWLVDSLDRLPIGDRERAALYDGFRLLLTWRLGDSAASRSRTRIPCAKLFIHGEPFIPRRAVSLKRELDAPPMHVSRVPHSRARRILDIILDTSAVRYRELYGFSHPDERNVYRARPGRGVEIYFFGVPPEWRLPLRAYHAGACFKNGVPVGYFEALSFFERAEIGFNLYYTFREGETAWLYAKLLRLCRQMLGVTCFTIAPHQIGHENEEAIDSGAFWFYRKLGFRSVDDSLARLTAAEEAKLATRSGYRTPPATLRKLAVQPMLYEHCSAQPGGWDSFRIGNLGLAVAAFLGSRFNGDSDRMRQAARDLTRHAAGVDCDSPLAQALLLVPGLQRWSTEDKRLLAGILNGKKSIEEVDYLSAMQRHPMLREAFLSLGSRPPVVEGDLIELIRRA